MSANHEIIALSAYYTWLNNGKQEGTHLKDWFEAESQFNKKAATQSPPRRGPKKFSEKK